MFPPRVRSLEIVRLTYVVRGDRTFNVRRTIFCFTVEGKGPLKGLLLWLLDLHFFFKGLLITGSVFGIVNYRVASVWTEYIFCLGTANYRVCFRDRHVPELVGF
jgi:hypothetical protein